MEVGELFVRLGVKGADKTVGALTETTKGMKTLGSASLETKAAIVGAMYGLEKLMAASGARGTALTNLGTLLGGKDILRVIQQYDYAAQQVLGANGEMEGSFKSLQSVINAIRFHGAAPEFAGALASYVGGLDWGKIIHGKDSESIPYLIQKLQQFARLKNVDENTKRELLSQWHLSDSIISAMEQNAFRPEVLARAPLYSAGEAKALQGNYARWANLGQNIEMSLGRFNAKHGKGLVKEAKEITDAFLGLADSLERISEQYGVFSKLASAVGELAGAMNDLTAYGQGKKDFWGNEIDPATGKPRQGARSFGDWFFGRSAHKRETDPDFIGPHQPSWMRTLFEDRRNPEINVHQTNVFQHDGKDPHKISDAHREAAKRALRQASALVQGS